MAFTKSRVTRLLAAALLAVCALPALAEMSDTGAVEARVDRLLWQLMNDERYGHLQIAANYERLRAQLLERACAVSAAPCAHSDRIGHPGQMMTTEISPEQELIVEELLFTIHSASATVTAPPANLLLTASE